MKILIITTRPTDSSLITEGIIRESIKKIKGFVPAHQVVECSTVMAAKTACKGNDVIAIFLGIEWIKSHLPSLFFLKQTIDELHKETLNDLPQIFICLERNIPVVEKKNLNPSEIMIKNSLTMIDGAKNVFVSTSHHHARTTFTQFYNNFDERERANGTRERSKSSEASIL